MVSKLDLGGIVMEVVKKDIKNVHLSVLPPAGRVRISAPGHMNSDTIRLFAISKLAWIKEQQRKLREQERESQREYLDRESHYVWGKRLLLKVTEEDRPPTVKLRPGKLLLSVRPGTEKPAMGALLASWYRQILRAEAEPLIKEWGPRLKVAVSALHLQQMKTKWGSCNPIARTIRLNTELARKPKECLEYIVVHEMAHLREPIHGPKFISLMDSVLPQWRLRRDVLNALPARHEQWNY